MPDIAVVRAILLLGPFVIGLGLWLARRPGYREKNGILLALLWNTIGLLATNTLAVRVGWWSFDVDGGLFLGVPIDLLLGWSLLWTCLGTLALPRWHPAVVVTVAMFIGLWLDWLLMPLADPIVVLHDHWLVGEVVSLAACLGPASLLARWTADDQWLGRRVVLHVIMFATMMLWLIPAVIFGHLGGGWGVVRERPPWLNILAGQIVLIPMVVGISAVQELFERGRGTPVPLDPPSRLVTSGVYAYLINPMQASMCLVFLAWGLFLESWWVTAAAAMAIVFSVGLGRWATNQELKRRFGRRWEAYRSTVRMWWPTWRPRFADCEPPARFYVDLRCQPCKQLAKWIEGQRPRALEIVPADQHVRELVRMTYEVNDVDGEQPYSCSGIVALSRALEHVHLGWAFIGWIVRLPVVRAVIQVLADAVGRGPRGPDERRYA